MKFRIEHLFPNMSPADFENVYFDEAFNIAMCQALKLGRELKKRELVNRKFSRVVRVTPDREIPGPVAKLLGTGDKLQYTEYIDYTWGSFRGTWRSESSMMTDKIDSSGGFGFEKKGDGVLRYVDGEIKVKIFGLGGVVERFIVADIERSYEQAAEFTRSWLAKK